MGPPSQWSPQTSRRQPLADATLRANINATSSRPDTKQHMPASSSNTTLPHHESLAPNGSLTVHGATSPKNRRLSDVKQEEQDSKRNSQVSTTSTNASGKTRRRKTHIGPWQLGGDIGKGGCGKVRKVRHSSTGQQAAVKIISKVVAEYSRAESLANLVKSSKASNPGVLAGKGHVMPFGIEREVVIMKLLEHQNVVRLFDIWENRNELYLIMEYVDGGELFEYVTEEGCLAEDETVWLFRQMVAALLHCHRLGIHHRDLKPENILVTRENPPLVKLADFGMAALQPKGRLLTTPCGSLHYAAPEVFEKNYDGSKIDVWSLGVILYVMLVGSTPFHYDPETMTHDVSLWYAVLKSGRFSIPRELSDEAHDLLRKMLVPEAKKRISLETVWNHPLIHKYEEDWGESPESGKLENWIGPKPLIEKWKMKERKDVDREILRNLRTLWHSEPEENLIQKIISKEPNQEKYFYYALEKHRDEQLENYDGSSGAIGYSTSDHHYIKKGPTVSEPPPPLPVNDITRTKSNYSILNNEHLYSQNSFAEPPRSECSYDPFRASRDPVVGPDKSYTTNVVVHRGASGNSGKQSVTSTSKHASSLRVEALREQQRRVSGASNKSSPHQKLSPSHRPKSAYRRSMSRSSVVTSTYPSSPPSGRLKPNIKHKRGVDFSQVRKASKASLLTTHSSDRAGSLTPKKSTPQKGTPKKQALNMEDEADSVSGSAESPATTVGNIVHSRKEAKRENPPHMQKLAANRSSQVIEGEARKFSSELEKYCEEVFFRSSGGSSHNTSTSTQLPLDTPPSSVSNRGSVASGRDFTQSKTARNDSVRTQYRQSADPSAETPTTFMNRELAETRKRLLARYAEDETAQNTTYNEVLAQLDALLKPKGINARLSDGRRITSAPDPQSPEYSNHLPVISEEVKLSREGEVSAKQRPLGGYEQRRTQTEPGGYQPRSKNVTVPPEQTIRVIEETSPPRIAPLVIRKTSGSTSVTSSLSDDSAKTRYYNPVNPPRSIPVRHQTPTSPGALDPISEESPNAEVSSEMCKTPAPTKRGGWFRWRSHTADGLNPKKSYLQAFQDLDDREKQTSKENVAQAGKRRSNPDSAEAQSPLSPTTPVVPGKRPGFLRFLGRRKASKQKENKVALAVDNDETRSISSQTGASIRSGMDSRRLSPQTPYLQDLSESPDFGVQRNWLARFLHIKPAAKVLCLNVPRGRARQELVRMLREWRIYGIRDIILDRARNLIFGRLDAVNVLGIKEVSFVVELYVVLENGKRAGLSIARFTQRKGAASSFKRVADTVQEVLGGRGLLVTEKEKVREMEGIFSGA